jgi:DNA-binding MarR family transcriptional regulator
MVDHPLRFPAKARPGIDQGWTSGSPQKTRRRNKPERVSDSEGTETALAGKTDRAARVVTWAGGAPIRRVPVSLARRFAQICTAVVAETLADEDLTPLQYAILANLNDDPDVDQIGIAGRLGIDRNTTGILVQQLEKHGLVRRQMDGADRRARLVSLTPKGDDLRERLRPLLAADQRRILSVLAPAELERFLDYLVRIIKANEAYARPGAKRRNRGARPPPAKKN